MTGIERLREFVAGISPITVVCDVTMTAYDREHMEVAGDRLRDFLADIADQIAREHAEDCFRMGERAADVSMSAYDLLPADEREAIAWVREHGGIGHVRQKWGFLRGRANHADHVDRQLAKRQRQIDESHAALRRKNERIEDLEAGSRDLQDADNRRVELSSALGVDTETGWADAMAEMCRRLMPEGMEWPRFEDGDPVRFGDEFIDHQGIERSVLNVKMWQEGGFEIGTGQGTYDWHEAGEHVKRPVKVLDADGVEIRKGDTVWHVETGRKYVVVEPSYGKTVVVRLAKYDDAEGEQHAPDQLTHERPDSWERLEEDVANASCPDVYCTNHNIDARDTSYEWAMACDIVRRARALAERDS